MRSIRTLIVSLMIVLVITTLQTAAPAKAVNRLTISTNPTYLYFGNQIVGTVSPTQTVIIKNTGSANVKLGKLTVTSEFLLRATECSGKTLIPGQSCTFGVSFKPLTAVYKTGSVTIPVVGETSALISLTGYGITGTNLLISPAFELPLPKPLPWKGNPPSFTLGSNLDCAVGLSPYCSAKIKGSPLNHPISLTQSIGRPGLIGDKYIFRLSSRAYEIPAGGQYKVELILMNMYNQVVVSRTLRFTSGTHNFETLMGTVTADEEYSWVIFRFTLQKPSGIAWFDNAELVKLP
jgi:hypothetical protein